MSAGLSHGRRRICSLSPVEVEEPYCSLLTHSLRRSHVKCNVVAKPTITHRRLTHTRERGQKLETIVEQQTEPY